MAPTAHLYRTVQDGAGNILIGAQVSLCKPGSTIPIPDQLYADETLTTRMDNPFTSMNGVVDVYLDHPVTVALVTTFGATTQVADHINVLPAAENMLAAQAPLSIDNDTFAGAVLQMVDQDSAQWVPFDTLGGGVASVRAGLNIDVDDDPDPAHPIISAVGLVETVQPGAGITVDDTDPAHPIVIAIGTGGPPGPPGPVSTVGSIPAAGDDVPIFTVPGGAAVIRTPEQYGTTDQAGLQTAMNSGSTFTDNVLIKLQSRVYTLGAVGDPTDGLTWDGTHGSIVIDARGATINYLGTGVLMRSSLHLGGNNPPRVYVLGGIWLGPTAQFGFYGLDIRSFYYADMRVQFDVGPAFCQANQDTYCERNTYERIDDHGSKQLLVMDRVPFKSVPTGGVVTFTATTGIAAFTVPHTLRVGERCKFNGLSGAFGIIDNHTYWAATVPTNSTLTLSSTEDLLTPVTITANGTAAQGWTEPAGSMARTRVVEAKIQGGVATFCKLQVTNGAAPYDSHFSVRGNVPDGVGVIDILGANSMGNTDLDLLRCEAVSSIAGGAFIMRWGQAGGFPPSMEPCSPIVRGMYLFDPLAPAPDNSKRIFGQHHFHGVESQAFQHNSFLDMYGRTNRTAICDPATPTTPDNNTLYLTDGTGAGHPADQIGNLVLAPSNGKHIYVDVSAGSTETYQQLDALLDVALASSTFVRTGDYTAVPNELVRAKPTTASTITLPTTPQDKTRVVIKNLSTTGGVVTVVCAGTDVFNEVGGVSSLNLTKKNQSIHTQYHAAIGTWEIITTDPGSGVAYLDSPAFINTPTAPTQTPGDNSTKLATTAFVAANVIPGQLLQVRTYAQSAQQPTAVTTGTFTTLQDLTAAAIAVGWAAVVANSWDLTFTGPPTGLVDVEMGLVMFAAAAASTARLGVFDLGTSLSVPNSTTVVTGSTVSTRVSYKTQFAVTPGQVYNWRPQFQSNSVSNAVSFVAGGINGKIRIAVAASV